MNLHLLKSIPVLVFMLAMVAGCSLKNPSPVTATDSGSTGSTGTPKNLKISWVASHAVDVGLTGGGYKVYVRKGSMPTLVNTTPVVVPNPGNGTHVTTTTLTLEPGKYYIVVSSYSTNGDSPFSTSYTTTVP